MQAHNLKLDIISACMAIQDFRKGNIMVEKEMRNFALRDGNGNEIGVFTGKSPRQAALGRQPGPHGHQAPGAGHEEGACIHRREGAGRQAQGRAGLDGRQDLEAAGQKSGRREAGRGLRP